MIAVTKKPTEAIKGDGNISKWCGVHQPMTFEVDRIDYSVKKMWNETHNGKLFKVFEISGIDNEFKKNLRFTFVCRFDGQLKSWSLVVDSVHRSQNKTFVYIDLTNVYQHSMMNATTSKILIERKGYFIETLIYKAKENMQLELIGSLRTKTDVWGKSIVNVQKIIASSLTNENKFKYDKINEPMNDQGGVYNIRLREVYDGFIGNLTTLLPTDVMYYVNGSKQIQEENNYNFGEFVPSLKYDRDNLAKFLSVFKKPTYFKGYPFSLSFIYSDLVLNKQLKRDEDGDLTNISIQGRGFVNRLMLAGDYSTTTTEIGVSIVTDGTATTDNPTTGGGTYTTGNVFGSYTERPTIRPARDPFLGALSSSPTLEPFEPVNQPKTPFL